jgi:hypothetical protein
MSDTHNEVSYEFFREGLTLLRQIKTNTDTILDNQENILCSQDNILMQTKLSNEHLDSITDLGINKDDIT